MTGVQTCALPIYHWVPVGLKAPDVMWGNNPDPMAQGEDAGKAPDLVIARRVDGR